VNEENIYVEKASTRLAVRPKLAEVRKLMRAGDVLVVTKVDRLARSLLDLITIANELREAGITLEVLTGTFNRDDPMGEAFFQMTGAGKRSDPPAGARGPGGGAGPRAQRRPEAQTQQRAGGHAEADV
jgi:hypothetical protein